jgi:hypothetical protein
MAAFPLENRTDRLFGRAGDLEQLLQRTRRTGLTAIVGQPQIGKSWLLMETARRLDREAEPHFLVGFTRSPTGSRTDGSSRKRHHKNQANQRAPERARNRTRGCCVD